jgi:hypothetical protein
MIFLAPGFETKNEILSTKLGANARVWQRIAAGIAK